jgi:hypothetical protein
MLATISQCDPVWEKIPNIRLETRLICEKQEICPELEPFLQECPCGGQFRTGAAPRCPHCHQVLSAELGIAYIETFFPETAEGRHWQRSWNGLYCMAIEDLEKPGSLRCLKNPLRWFYDPAIG